MKPLYTKKNGTSQRVAAIEVKMPASYPSSNVTYGSGSVEDALDNLPSVITTSVINCATIVNNNYYGDLVTPSGYTALGILSIVSKNFTQSTGIVDYRIENNQVRIRVINSGYQGSFDVVVLFVKTS